MAGRPRAVGECAVRHAACPSVETDEQPVVGHLEGGACRRACKQGRVVMSLASRGDRLKHVGRDERVVDVARDAAHAHQPSQRQAKMEARRVDQHIGWHANHCLRHKQEGPKRLPQQGGHWIAPRLDPPAAEQANELHVLADRDAKGACCVGANLLVRHGVARVNHHLPAL